MSVEPFGFPERDLRHGMLCATILAPYMQKGRVADPRDYMLRRTPERELTVEETKAEFRAAFGSGTKKKKE